MTMDDGTLIERILNGDTAAGGELIDRYYGLVRWTITRHSFPACDIDELVADAWEKVWDADCHVLRQWNRQSPFASYLCRCVHNYCLDRLRKQQREGSRRKSLYRLDPEEGDWVEWDAPDPAPGPQQILEMKELRTAIQQALGDLPSLDRQIIELAYFEEKKQREIAALIGRDIKQIGSLLARAQKKLRKALSERAPGLFQPEEKPSCDT